MFWGLKMEPGKRYAQTVDQSFHVSMACLEMNNSDNDFVPVMLDMDNQEYILCNLHKNKAFQCQLDLNFRSGDRIAFYSSGKSRVHLTGYLIEPDDIDNSLDLDGSNEEEEEEEKESTPVKNTKKLMVKDPSSNKRKNEPQLTKQGVKKPKINDGYLIVPDDINNSPYLDDSDEEEEEEEESTPVKNTKEVVNDLSSNKKKNEPQLMKQEVKKPKINDDDEYDDDDDDDDDEDDDDYAESESEDEVLSLEEDSDEDDSDSDEDDSDYIPKTKVTKTPELKKEKLNKSLQEKQNTPNEEQSKKKKKKKNKTPNEKTQADSPKTPSSANEVNGSPALLSSKKLKMDNETPGKSGQTPGSAGGSAKKTRQGGVIVEDIKVGDGQPAKFGKRVTVYYVGRLKQNNKQFDATTRGPGFKFQLGTSEVIKGWDVGVVGMKVGGKRRITCPANMAYGTKGSPPVIPPNSTLVFEVELKSVN